MKQDVAISPQCRLGCGNDIRIDLGRVAPAALSVTNENGHSPDPARIHAFHSGPGYRLAAKSGQIRIVAPLCCARHAAACLIRRNDDVSKRARRQTHHQRKSQKLKIGARCSKHDLGLFLHIDRRPDPLTDIVEPCL